MINRNPAFKESSIQNYYSYDQRNSMSINGLVNKSILLWIMLLASATYTWYAIKSTGGFNPIFIPVAAIGTLILSLIMAFKPNLSPYLSPIYALTEGMLLSIISLMFEARYGGIVLQAVFLTMCIFGSLLFLYRLGLIKASAKFRAGVMMATSGLLFFYLINFVLGFFGMNMTFHLGATPIGIGFSVIVVILASAHLILDFDYIERASERGLPKYFEWYFSFALMVTLVWLYLEILKLLAKLNDRKR